VGSGAAVSALSASFPLQLGGKRIQTYYAKEGDIGFFYLRWERNLATITAEKYNLCDSGICTELFTALDHMHCKVLRNKLPFTLSSLKSLLLTQKTLTFNCEKWLIRLGKHYFRLKDLQSARKCLKHCLLSKQLPSISTATVALQLLRVYKSSGKWSSYGRLCLITDLHEKSAPCRPLALLYYRTALFLEGEKRYKEAFSYWKRR